MFFRVKKIQPVVYSFLLVLTLLFLGSIGTVQAAALIDAPSANPPTLTPVQYYPYHYPPGYYPPTPDPYQDTKGAMGSGWIFIEVEPPEAAVFIDGHKLEPREDNTYEEGCWPDATRWRPKRGATGIICGLSTFTRGPRKA